MSAIDSEGIRRAIILEVTGFSFSPSSIFIASRTKSIFHFGKGDSGPFIAASTKIMGASMALNPTNACQQQNGRPSF
jgi:hypothetical protein